MTKIAITGLNGVIGKILAEELSKNTQIIDLFHTKKYSGRAIIQKHIKLDLLKKDKISKILQKADPDVIIHLAAITHIDRCEKDKKNGKKGKVWRTNVEGACEIAKFCAKNKIHMIFLSTECVFNGKQKYYAESAKKNPINWYGATKSEAEDLVMRSGASVTIIRSVVAYHKNDENKTIYGKILNELKSGKSVLAVSDQLFTPTHTYDIVTAISKVIKKKLFGIYHVAPKKSLSPYDLAKLIAKRNKYPQSLVKKTTLRSFYGPEKTALRLRNSSLSSQKSNRIFKFIPKSPEQVL